MKREIIQPYIDKGLISVQKHPTEDLFIYNYTHRCQFDKAWDDVTEQCRGLIQDGSDNVISRPFRKFYNLEEHLEKNGAIPDGPFKLYDKFDGSLGIGYFNKSSKFRIATRGSFTSEQAEEANKMLDERSFNISGEQKVTYLFEIIYPANRIVVDYGDRRTLVFLAAIETETGKDVTEQELPYIKPFFDVAHPLSHLEGEDLLDIKKVGRENSEGFVVVWPDGFRLKIKYDEYVRLHRLITGVSEKRIWEMLRDKESMNELLEKVPDEFYDWVSKTVFSLRSHFATIATIAFLDISTNGYVSMERKAAALHVLEHNKERSGVIFAMLDGRDWHKVIWRMIRPQGSNTFARDIDS